MFGWIRRAFSRRPAPITAMVSGRYDWQKGWDEIGIRIPGSSIRAKYDAAQTTNENRRHWANADGLSANAANSPEVRRTLRNRTRYEVANNTHAKNIVLSLANYTVGTGPRLQMVTSDDQINRAIESEWTRWTLAIDLPGKLRTMRMAKAEDGEAFAVFITRNNYRTPVSLDIRLYEADQVTTPGLFMPTPNNLDGVVLDDNGIPVEYHLATQHPGDTSFGINLNGYRRMPASQVLHYFRQDRPGQARGVSELTAALPLFALLRRYGLATLHASEEAATHSGVLQTRMPPAGDQFTGEGAGQAAEMPIGATLEAERGAMTVLPEGWEMKQIDAKFPTAQFEMFHDKILGDIGCVLQLPFCVVACNSSGYNYASGRLDYQSYDLSLKIERATIEQQILDRAFAAWIDEAIRIEGYLPQPARMIKTNFDHQWFWDGREHVDPSREANAQETRLRNRSTNLAFEYAKTGRDWEVELSQWRKERAVLFKGLLEDGLKREEAIQVAYNKQAQMQSAVSDVQPDENKD